MKLTIRLSDLDDVKRFVDITSRYEEEISLMNGDYEVDAKSILGIFSLDLSRSITLEIYSDDCEDLLKEIQPFLESGD